MASKTMKSDVGAQTPPDGQYFGGKKAPPLVKPDEAKAKGGNIDGLAELAQREPTEIKEIDRGPVPAFMQPPKGDEVVVPKKKHKPPEFKEGESETWRRNGKRY